MTDSENMERVAAWFEKKPEGRSWGEPFISPKYVWEWRAEWRPRLEYLTDESASAILRDAMAPHGLRVFYTPEFKQWVAHLWEGVIDPKCIPLRSVPADQCSVDPDYKRAIFGAFLKFMEEVKRDV